MTEHDEQCALVRWANSQAWKYPALENLFAIPNGGKRKNGWWEKAEGLKAGVPDLFLAVPKWSSLGNEYLFHGLFIEMKFGKNKSSSNQLCWQGRLVMQGYQVEVCYSFEEAQRVVLEYLKEEDCYNGKERRVDDKPRWNVPWDETYERRK